ncbi:MAG: cache domain-containing protein [Treponema sp.]|nr:cache domain-containing protein [Treponema sp.]
MNQNERVQERDCECESLYKQEEKNEPFNPIRFIIPNILLLLIIALVILYSYVERKNIIENAEQVTNQMVEYISATISNKMGYAESSIKLAATTISQSMTSDTLENPAELIEPMIDNTPFGGIEYIRADGMNIMTVGKPFDASDRGYYIEGIKGNTGIWNNYHPKSSQETLINFYTPIFYKDKISGVLTGYIAATSQIEPVFDTKIYGQKIYGLLIDENDMVICSSIKDQYIQDLSLDLFMDRFNANKEQKSKVINIINCANEKAVSYRGLSRGERICVSKIPKTGWKVVIIVPQSSYNAIVSLNTRNSITVILIISLILITYSAAVLIRNINRRREIVNQNEKLEKENRFFNEENKRAFSEITAIRDIVASAQMGIWRMEILEGQKSKMYCDPTMISLMGIVDKNQSPEKNYEGWFNNISPQAINSVLESLNKMKEGKFDENTYLWRHPSKGERYVRCGGSSKKI